MDLKGNLFNDLMASLAVRLGFAKLSGVDSESQTTARRPSETDADSNEKPHQEAKSTHGVHDLLTDRDAKLLESLATAIVEKHGNVENSLRFLAEMPEGFDSINRPPSDIGDPVPMPESAYPGGSLDQTPSSIELDPHETTDYSQQKSQRLSDHSASDSDHNDPFSPSRQRYEIKKFLARGGIGEVSVAIDREFNREVAFKEIRSDRDSNRDQVNRFWVEAQVTGNLEHPGIVPVYSLGKRENEEPFYAMRFIRGESMTDAIKDFHAKNSSAKDSSRLIQFRKLLQNFVSVCNTIHFAHNRNVIHRDIKPDNIMLGSFGETLVVDWGLAKTLGDERTNDSAEDPNAIGEEKFDLNNLKISSIPELVDKAKTQQGAIMGTLGYMSPEQLLGWQDKIDARSDVFSLGGLLYAILSGTTPNAKESIGKITENTLSGTTKPVRQINPEVSRSLEAVVNKAMSPKPDERYQSAADLASDIEAFLADEAVSAVRDPLTVRIRRWLRRHPAITSATLASIALTIVGLAIGLGVVGSFNSRLEKANVDLTLANQREVAERGRAEANFQIAESAVETYLTKTAADPNLATPQFSSIRKSLLQTAIPFYEKFLAQRPDDLEYDLGRGKAHFRLGQIYFETGDYNRGIEQFQSSLTTFESLETGEPDSREWTRWRCRCLNELVGCYFRLNEHEKAVAAANQSIEMLSGLLEQSPDDAEVLRDLMNVTSNIGASLFSLEKYREAEASAEKHVKLIEKLNAIEGAVSPQNRFQLAVNLNNLGAIKNQQQQWQAGFDRLVKAINIGNELIKEYPNVQRYRHNLAQAYHNVGRSLAGMKNYAQAIANFQVADHQDTWLSRTYPNVAKYKLSLGMNYKSMGTTYLKWSRPKEALDSFQKAEAAFQQLVTAYPEVSEYRLRLALTYNNLGMYEIFPNDVDKRLAYSKRAVDALELLVKRFPTYADYRYQLAAAQTNLALCYRDGKQIKEALKWYLASSINNEKLDAESLAGRQSRVNTFWGLGECYVELEEHAKATDAWNQAARFSSDPAMAHIFQVRSAKSCALAGDLNQSEKMIKKVLDYPQKNPETYFRVAEIHAICAAKSEMESEGQARFIDLTLGALEQCKAAGGFEQPGLVMKMKNNEWIQEVLDEDTIIMLLGN